ncbi:MAG: hypothetical protein EXQ98_04755 [Alphaproteobacteria bacterium]|nr:hypothetical protein [Alphaproteobacteria bacterium]
MAEILMAERIGAVERLTINRPEALNALNAQVLSALKSAFDRIAGDEGVRAVILTGAGEKAFVAGADIKEMANIGPREAEALSRSAKIVRVAPPPGVNSPALWGTKAWLEEQFKHQARQMAIEEKAFVFRYRSVDHFLDIFRAFYGPVHKAFLALDPAGQAALANGLRATIARFNTASDDSMRVPSNYAEIVITKA